MSEVPLSTERGRQGACKNGREHILEGRHPAPWIACATSWVVNLHDPLSPAGFNSPNIAQRHALHVERTAEKAFMLSLQSLKGRWSSCPIAKDSRGQ